MPITIRQARTAEDRQRIFRFRYEIYVEEMGRRQTYANHADRTIIEGFDETGHLFLAEDEGGRVVGTVRTNFGRDTNFGYYHELYGMDCLGRYAPQQASISTKFMIAPHLRQGTLAYRIATTGYTHNLESGILFDFLDCNAHLEDAFKRLGYQHYRNRVQHPEYGNVMPMILPMTDLHHLETIGSPWARICRDRYPHLDANRLLHQAIQSYHCNLQTQAA